MAAIRTRKNVVIAPPTKHEILIYIIGPGFDTDTFNITLTFLGDDNTNGVVVDGGPLGPAPDEMSGIAFLVILYLGMSCLLCCVVCHAGAFECQSPIQLLYTAFSPPPPDHSIQPCTNALH